MKVEKKIAITYFIAFAVAGAIIAANCLFFTKPTALITIFYIVIGGLYAATWYLGFVWVESRAHIWLARLGVVGFGIMVEGIWMLQKEIHPVETVYEISLIWIIMFFVLYFVASNHGKELREESLAPIQIFEFPFDDPFDEPFDDSEDDSSGEEDDPPEGPEDSD